MSAEPVAALVTTDLAVGGHDLCGLREPGREEARQAGRGHGDRQSGHRAGPGEPSVADQPRGTRRDGREGRLHGRPARAARRSSRREDADGDAESDDARQERDRLLITALLAVPVLVLSMVPALQFRNWQWLCFVLTAPVAVWGSWPFHVRAVRGLRHSTATMDTLVSLGVVASFSWSAYALFLGGAGDPGMRMPFTLVPSASDGVAHIYLEAAVGVPLFVLTGRFLEARARRGTGAALRSLAELAAKEVSVREDGIERLDPHRGVEGRAGLRRAARGAGRHRRRGGGGEFRGGSVPGHRGERAGRGRAGLGRGRRGRQRRRAAARTGDGRRRRHPTRPHHPAGHRCAGRQGARSAAGRLGRRCLRARRAGAGRHRTRVLAGCRGRSAGGDHGLCGRPGRGVPVRAGPRDPDRAHGRDRTGCPAGCPRHRTAGTGGASAHRRRRPRQDRHAHLRAHERRPGHRRTGRARS